MSRLVLVKHALPQIDASKPPREWHLGAEGEAQAKRLAERLRAFEPLRMVTSPEPKAARTAELAAAELGLTVACVDGLQEIDRPALRLMSREEHAAVNQAIFTEPDRRVLGSESAREALERFSAALGSELRKNPGLPLVVTTHGTVISLFVGNHNAIDAFALWKRLECPSWVVLEDPAFTLVEVVDNAASY